MGNSYSGDFSDGSTGSKPAEHRATIIGKWYGTGGIGINTDYFLTFNPGGATVGVARMTGNAGGHKWAATAIVPGIWTEVAPNKFRISPNGAPSFQGETQFINANAWSSGTDYAFVKGNTLIISGMSYHR